MLLKLQMPYVDRQVEAAVVVKWHKTEGASINYGDDLLDVNVELTSRGKPRMAPWTMGVQESGYRVRVVSSDRGTLRRIYAQEGARRNVGDVLALLVPDQAEPPRDTHLPDETSPELAQASVFRVVTNLSPAEEEMGR